MTRLQEAAESLKIDSRPALEAIVAAVKAGMFSPEEGVAMLESDFAGQQRYRQEREVPLGMQVDSDDVLPDTTAGEISRKETANLLLRIINGLPPRQGQCIDLYYFGGLTQEAIADKLGITKQAVNAYLRTAREKMASALENEEDLQAIRQTAASGPYVVDLMRCPYRKPSHSRGMRFPWEVHYKWAIGGRWSGNGIYTTMYQNRLGEYLKECFEEPPLVGWFSARCAP